ncbi:MAG: hypothetical protein AAFR67_04870, partial [Chloroflexota bacterium]
KLQNRVKNAYDQVKKQGGQIVIYGKKGHAEVIGLTGQTQEEAIIVGNATLTSPATTTISIDDVVPTSTSSPDSQTQIAIFDPALSKIGLLLPGELGLLGERLQWVTTITNNGTVTGTNVIFTDTLRLELRVESVTSTQGIGIISGQTVTVNLGDIVPGQVITVIIETTVLQSNITVDNIACVDADNSSEICVLSAPISTVNVTELPATGETPWWRDALLIVLTSLILCGGAIGVNRLRDT